jgi:hypothetical protein
VFHGILSYAAEVAKHCDCDASVTLGGKTPSFASEVINNGIHDCVALACWATLTRSKNHRNTRDIAATQKPLGDRAAVRHGPDDPEESTRNQLYAGLTNWPADSCSSWQIDASGSIDKGSDGICRKVRKKTLANRAP